MSLKKCISGKEQKRKLLKLYSSLSITVAALWIFLVILISILHETGNDKAEEIVHTIELCVSCLIYIVSGFGFMVVGYKVYKQFSRYTQSILFQKNEFASSQGYAISKRIGVLAGMFTATLIIKSVLTAFIYFYFYGKSSDDFSENDVLVNIVIRVINQMLFEFVPCLFSFVYLYRPISSSKNVRYNKITVNN